MLMMLTVVLQMGGKTFALLSKRILIVSKIYSIKSRYESCFTRMKSKIVNDHKLEPP